MLGPRRQEPRLDYVHMWVAADDPSYNPAMTETIKPAEVSDAGAPATSPGAPRARRASCSSEAVICERCGAEMFRMHAVWRCPECRFKTDCCGW